MIFLGPEDTQETWSASQKSLEAATRVEGVPPTLWAPRGSPDLDLPPIYILKYLENFPGSNETTFPPSQPSVPVRSHLGTFFGVLSEGDLIMEGIYVHQHHYLSDEA